MSAALRHLGKKAAMAALPAALAVCLVLAGPELAQAGREGSGQGAGQNQDKAAPDCCPDLSQFYPKNPESLEYQEKIRQGAKRRQDAKRSGWTTVPAAEPQEKK